MKSDMGRSCAQRVRHVEILKPYLSHRRTILHWKLNEVDSIFLLFVIWSCFSFEIQLNLTFANYFFHNWKPHRVESTIHFLYFLIQPTLLVLTFTVLFNRLHQIFAKRILFCFCSMPAHFSLLFCNLNNNLKTCTSIGSLNIASFNILFKHLNLNLL